MRAPAPTLPGTVRARRRWLRLAGGELALLVILAVAAGALFVFVQPAGGVLDGELHDLDRRLLLALREPSDLADPIGPGWFEEMARDFTALGSMGVLVVLTLVACGYLLMIARPASALLVAAAVGGGILASTLLKRAFDRPRPDLVPHVAEVYTASFPSGHAMLSAIAYLTLGALLMRLQPRLHAKIYVLVVALALQHRRRVEPDAAVIQVEAADAAEAARAARAVEPATVAEAVVPAEPAAAVETAAAVSPARPRARGRP